MHLGYLAYTFDIVYESFSVGVICCHFSYMECITDSYMALHIDDQHILYYHMHMHRSNMMGCSYFQSPDFVVVKGWIRALFLYQIVIQLTGPNIHYFTEFCHGVVGYDIVRYVIFPCHITVAVLLYLIAL